MIEIEKAKSGGNQAAWRVWGLAFVGVGTVAFTLYVVRGALSDIRRERAKVATIAGATRKLVAVFSLSSVQRQTDLKSLLDGQPGDDLDYAAPMRRSLDQFKGAMGKTELLPEIQLLEQFVTDIDATTRDCNEWSASNLALRAAINERHEHAQAVARTICDWLERADGRKRLAMAEKVHRYRNLIGAGRNGDSDELATEIISEIAPSDDGAEIQSAVLHLSLLCQQFLEVEDTDHLNELKDNVFSPSLFHLVRAAGRYKADQTSEGPNVEQLVREFSQTIFGKDCRLDDATQTIEPAQGGLFLLCRERLKQRQHRSELGSQVGQRLAEYQAAHHKLTELAETLTARLSGQAEAALHAAWRKLLVVGSLGVILAFAFALRVAGTIKRQILAIEASRAELGNSRSAAEAASRAKSEFLANMSHEIRTPLNGVLGVTQLLKKTELNERQQHYVDLITFSGDSLAQLINDILDFSKIEANKLELESVEFDLHAAVEDVVEMMSQKAGQKGLEMASAVPNVPRLAIGDPVRTKQILINLANNAIKFTETGSVCIALSIEERSREHMVVRFAVTDTGIGIPPDRMDRLFKSFSQVDASTTRTHGGTGLGLAISKQLATLMGGRIGVESTIGRGSTFWFTIMFALPAQEEQAMISVDGESLPVLVVDTLPSVRELLRSQMSSWGLKVDAASSSFEALAMLADARAQGKPYRAAIVDSKMPEMTGLELGKAIRCRPELASTMLFLMFPPESEIDSATWIDCGFVGYLYKPVRQSALYNSLIGTIAGLGVEGPPEIAPVRRTEPLSKRRPEPQEQPVATACHAHILVADDNEINRFVASEVLKQQGFTFDLVVNGKMAVAAVFEKKYDLVLMDCLMPEQDGFEATREIRAREQSENSHPSGHIPIIALTANAMSGDREQCLAAGMDAYVTKPLGAEKLVTTIRSLLSNSAVEEPAPAPPVETAPKEPVSTVIGIEALLSQCMGSVETAVMILDEFEKQAIANVTEIEENIQKGDADQTRRVAHTLKGASAIVAAQALSQLAADLEKMGRAGDLAEAGKLVAQLKDEVQRCIEYMPTVRAALSAQPIAAG